MMHKDDTNRITEYWHRETSYLNNKIDDAFKDAQDDAYAVGLARGRAETQALRETVVGLLEILRDWEPDNASGEERQKILQAMYQTGILADPIATVQALAEAPN